LIRQIRKLGHLGYSQPDFGQPPNQPVKMSGGNPAGAVCNKFLEINIHQQRNEQYTDRGWESNSIGFNRDPKEARTVATVVTEGVFNG
jgi:hypothetical protein